MVAVARVLGHLALESAAFVPVLALAFALIAGLGIWLQRATRFGRSLYLIGSNPTAARLAGLPIAVKDYNDVAGQPTTYGSPLFAVASFGNFASADAQGLGRLHQAVGDVPQRRHAQADAFRGARGAGREEDVRRVVGRHGPRAHRRRSAGRYPGDGRGRKP